MTGIEALLARSDASLWCGSKAHPHALVTLSDLQHADTARRLLRKYLLAQSEATNILDVEPGIWLAEELKEAEHG